MKTDTRPDSKQSEGRSGTAGSLAKVLADTYILYLKTQNFHWNVTGAQFASLHELFEQQYAELSAAVDGVAERIRALGARAPGSFAEFKTLGSIDEAKGTPKAEEMIRTLAADHETVARTAQDAMAEAEAADDAVSVDMMVERVEAHQKAIWMLRSLLA